MATVLTFLAHQCETSVTRIEEKKMLQILLGSERLQLHLIEALISCNNAFKNVGTSLKSQDIKICLRMSRLSDFHCNASEHRIDAPTLSMMKNSFSSMTDKDFSLGFYNI